MQKESGGFTLIEIIIVLAVIAILVTLAIPSGGGRLIQKQVVETIEIVDRYKPFVEARFYATGKFPIDNEAAGLPEADKIIGNYLNGVTVAGGAMHLEFGKKFPEKLRGKILSLRPVYVKGSPNSPISWVCGMDEVASGMVAAGENLTTFELPHLPLRCR